jgi:hypothetical protein
MVAAFAAGLVTQLGLSWNSRSYIGQAGELLIQLRPQWHWGLLPAYLQRVVGSALGERTTGYLWAHIGVPVEVILAIALVILVLIGLVASDVRTRVLVPLMVALSVVYFVYSGYQRWESAGFRFLWAKGTWWTDAAHYTIVPVLLLLSALIVELDSRPQFIASKIWRRVCIGSLIVLIVAAVSSFEAGDSSRGNPSWFQAVATARTECIRSSFDSVGVTMVPGYIPVSMQLPCSKLIGSRAPHYPDRTIDIVTPASDATVSGARYLRVRVTDSAHVTNVTFFLTPGKQSAGNGTYADQLPYPLARSMRTSNRWTALWATTSYPNGKYSIQAVAYYPGGDEVSTPLVPVVVKNRDR